MRDEYGLKIRRRRRFSGYALLFWMGVTAPMIVQLYNGEQIIPANMGLWMMTCIMMLCATVWDGAMQVRRKRVRYR